MFVGDSHDPLVFSLPCSPLENQNANQEVAQKLRRVPVGSPAFAFLWFLCLTLPTSVLMNICIF